MNKRRVPSEYLDAIVEFDLFYSGRVAGLDRRFSRNVETNPTERRIFHALGTAPDGRTTTQLRWQLDLDSGYLTRLIQRMRAGGFVEVEPYEYHSKVMVVRLTRLGRGVYAENRDFGRRIAEQRLRRLPGIAQLRIVQAMRTVERLLTAHPGDVFLEYRWRKKNKEPWDG